MDATVRLSWKLAIFYSWPSVMAVPGPTDGQSKEQPSGGPGFLDQGADSPRGPLVAGQPRPTCSSKEEAV